MQECGKQGSGPRAIAYAIIRIHGSQHDRFRRGGLVGGREQEAALHGVASFGASAHSGVKCAPRLARSALRSVWRNTH